MTDEHKLIEQVEQGDLAGFVLENPAFKRIAEDVSREYGKAFKGDDLEKALHARDEARALEKLLTRLTKVQSNGARAAEQLQELRNRKDSGLPIDATSLNGVA